MAPFKKIFGLGKSTQEISSTDAAQRHEKNEGSKLSTSVKTYRSTHVCLDCKKVTKLDLHVQLQKGGFVDGKVHFEQEAERGDTTCVLTIKTADTPAPPISESGFVRDPQHRALYAFLGQSTNEMTLKKGDFVTLLQKGSAGWWLLMDSSGRQGWAPGTYLTEHHVNHPEIPTRRPTLPPPYSQ